MDSNSFGKEIKFTIPRHGDFLENTFKYKLPEIKQKANPKTLFENCSLKITLNELENLPEAIREDCERNRRELDHLPIILWR
jgi:hypothetical protein